MAQKFPEILTRLNITGMDEGRFAALSGEAHQYVVAGILMRLGFNVSVITVRAGTYDLIVPAFESHSSNPEKIVLVRAQVRTVGGHSLRLIGGVRAGVDRVYLPKVKEYKYTTKDNDLIIAVDPFTIDLFFVPTRYIDRWGKSVSKRKLQPLKNNWEILLNWNEDFLSRLEQRLFS